MTRTILISAAFALVSGTAAAQVDYTAIMQGQMDVMSYTAMTNVGVAAMCGHEGVDCDDSASGGTEPVPVLNWLEAAEAARLAGMTPEDFSYQRDPAITAAVEQEFVADMRQRNPQAASEVEAVLRGTSLVDEFDRAMDQLYGLNGTDLADSFAAYWVLNWMVANRVADGAPQEPTAAEVQAVRDQVALAMTHNPGVRALDQAQRQLMSESLIYNTMMLDAALNQATQPGNEAAFDQLSEVWQLQGQRVLGLDMRGLDLTADGFVPRG